MAISIELTVNGAVVGGFESWWDEMEPALVGHEDEYPLLSRVDPYGNVVYDTTELKRVLVELQGLREVGTAPQQLIEKLEALSIAGLAGDGSHLRFRGD